MDNYYHEYARKQFALAPGMGLNAHFTYGSWQVALVAVFFEEIIFIILSLTRVRTAVIEAINIR